jgi:hypothetical protein
MKIKNPIDEYLGANTALPMGVREGTVWVTDTMDLAWKIAQSVFEKKATPEIAVAIFDRLSNRIEQERETKLEEIGSAGTPHSKKRPQRPRT